MKLRSAGRFVSGAIALLAVLWGSCYLFPKLSLNGFNPQPVIPGKINLLAVRRDSGYRIIVSNGIAHLVEIQGADNNFDAPSSDQDTQDAARLPIRETLKSMQGDVKSLGYLVMSVAKIKQEDLPATKVIWKAEDIQKALNGDAALKEKLERDLNTRLDGTPLDTVNLDAILDGIVIDSPVSVSVPQEGKLNSLTCRIQEAYKTLFAGSIEKKVNDRFNLSREALLAFYREEANKVLSGKRRENVADSLKSHTDPVNLQQKAGGPERILANTTVLVNENQMSGASSVTRQGQNRTILSDVTLKLTDDGRKRLWKYSHENPGFQLLLTVDGVAIAAPRIKTELAESEVKLTGVPSREQVVDAVDFINKTAAGSKQ